MAVGFVSDIPYSALAPVLALAVAASSYLIYLSVFRLYLSPIAKFPGPKLAALSKWYDFYYDVVLKGQFTFHIQELHRKYGPIVRISPSELHINDPDFYDVFFSQDRVRNKYEWTDGRLGNPLSFFGTSNHQLHRLRRAPLNPMFSKGQITKFEPVISDRVDALYRRFREYSTEDKVVPLTLAFTTFSQDVICQFAFAHHFSSIESPGFEDGLWDAYQAAAQSSHLALHFPWLLPTMSALPDWLVVTLQPKLRKLLALQQLLSQQVEDIRNNKNEDHKQVDHPTIFHELLQSSLPPEEKSTTRLKQEAQNVVGAGLVTAAWSLAVASFHIINDPEISRKLRDELVAAIPNPSQPLPWGQLEKLPYLHGCVHEGLRLSYGVTSRLARVAPQEILRYQDWDIPAGTPVSQTIVDVNHSESIYPDSHRYVPERWFQSNPDRVKDRHFVTFSKGTRMCIGLNLAYAELFKCLAMVFRRFRFELYETDVTDVALAHDFFLPSPKLDSKGVRARIVSVE